MRDSVYKQTDRWTKTKSVNATHKLQIFLQRTASMQLCPSSWGCDLLSKQAFSSQLSLAAHGMFDLSYYAVFHFSQHVQWLLIVQVSKKHIHARVTGLPVCPELTRDTVPKSSDVGCFLSISGAHEFDSLWLSAVVTCEIKLFQNYTYFRGLL